MKKPLIPIALSLLASCTTEFDDINLYIDEFILIDNISDQTSSTTQTNSSTIELINKDKLEWVAYFNYFSVLDLGWLQRNKDGFLMQFNFANNIISMPDLPTYSYPLDKQFTLKDNNNNVVELFNNNGTWKASINELATSIKFLYKVSNNETIESPEIIINKNFNQFFVKYNGDIIYSNN